MNPEDDPKFDDAEFDDLKLQAFLQQHRPAVPPPAPGLEAKILAEIAPKRRSSQPRSSQPRSVVWLVPPAIAAGLVATLLSYRSLTPTQPTATELANLEAFLETSWRGSINDRPEDALLPPSETISTN
jgi:hypothetical protein